MRVAGLRKIEEVTENNSWDKIWEIGCKVDIKREMVGNCAKGTTGI